MKGRKTGGRTVDTPNKATSSLHAMVEEEAGAPLPVLLTRIGVKAMKDGDHQLAVNALSKAAAYTYPRMQAVTLDTTEPVVYPVLCVGPDGKARIPENYPGLVILFDDIKNADGTTTTKGATDEPPDHVITWTNPPTTS